MGERPLTERQQKFVDAYAASGNGTRSAAIAGYGVPEVEAVRLLKNARVASAITQASQSRRSKAIATFEERQRFWTRTFRSKKIELRERLKASELLGKAQGDFLERHEIVSGSLIDVMVYVPSNARG